MEKINLTRKQVRNILRREAKKNKTMTVEKTRIAVYGTLCRGFKGNEKYLKGAEFLGTFDSKPQYTMYNLKHYPGVVKNGDTSIRMEVFEVKNDMISVFDKIEGYSGEAKSSKNIFERSKILTPFGVAHIYLYANLEKNPTEPTKVESGNWKNVKLK